MAEGTKKKQQKSRNDPKEQRRPRQRNQTGPVEQKNHKKIEELQAVPKSVSEGPGPEFFKNLKRETDEILKITEEENTRYKKKEIQSNWSKYEVQMESYDDIQEQENMGADYETLTQAPLSIGGYFQFKHEKSWDVDIGPSPYDKYFEINDDSLFLAISTLPFYERNHIPKNLLTEQDILNINNRVTRYIQKYDNDVLTTREESLEVRNNYSSDSEKSNIRKYKNTGNIDTNESTENEIFNIEKNEINTEHNISNIKSDKPVTMDEELISNPKIIQQSKNFSIEIDNIDDLIEGDLKIINDNIDTVKSFEIKPINDTPKVPKIITLQSTEIQKSPVTESTEDLEKWLDDFLDG